MGTRTDGKESLMVGIDCRGALPAVCCQTARMKEPELLKLDWQEPSGWRGRFARILARLKQYGRKERIRAALTLPDLEEESVRAFLRDACEAGFSREQLQVLGEEESIAHFVMHQSGDIWRDQVWLLEFGDEELRAVSLSVNRRTTPQLVRVSEPEYWYVGNDAGRDERLSGIVKDRFGAAPVSAVFLTGTDFSAADYPKSREAVCFRRRVFLADEIYARGACMAAGMSAGKAPYLFLSEQTLAYNVGIRSRRDGKESIVTLIPAGGSWYEARAEEELILLEDSMLELVFQPMMGGEPLRAGMLLDDLPIRELGIRRVRLKLSFSGPRQCEVQASDLGFGSFSQARDLYWQETFSLEEEERHGTGAGLRP